MTSAPATPGDEFIVVLPGCGRDEAENKRLELQRGIERMQFEPVPGTPIPLSISAGAAVFPHDGETYETLLAIADQRMYQDKSGLKRAPRQLQEARLEEVVPAAEFGITAAS